MKPKNKIEAKKRMEELNMKRWTDEHTEEANMLVEEFGIEIIPEWRSSRVG